MVRVELEVTQAEKHLAEPGGSSGECRQGEGGCGRESREMSGWDICLLDLLQLLNLLVQRGRPSRR